MNSDHQQPIPESSEAFEVWDIESGNQVIYDKNIMATALKIHELVVSGATDLSILLPGKAKALDHKATISWAEAVITMAEQGRL